MKKYVSILFVIIISSILLSGCSSEVENPYKDKSQEPVFEVNAKLFNKVDRPGDNDLGNEDNFVVRVKLNAYNVNISGLSPNNDRTELAYAIASMVNVEAGDYSAKYMVNDTSDFKYSVENSALKGILLFYVLPAECLKEDIKVAIYNISDEEAPDRKIIYETSDFVRIGFKEDIYDLDTASEDLASADPNASTAAEAPAVTNVPADPDDLTDPGLPVSSDPIAKPEGIEYYGTAAFPQAEQFTFDLILSEDKSKVLYMETKIVNLEVEQQNGNTVSTYQAGEITTTDGNEYDITDGVISIDTGDYSLHAAVLDTCIYGVASYTYTYQGDSTVSIDLGTVDTILENKTTPGTLPENLTDLIQQFKKDIE